MISLKGFLMTVTLLAALQGVVIGFLLFYSKRQRRSNRLLASLLWLMSLASFNLYFEYIGFYYSSSILALIHALIPMVIIMPIGPLIFFYVRSSIDPSFKLGKKECLHFIPTLLDLVPALIAIVFLAGASAGWLVRNPEPWGLAIDTYNIYADIPRFISLVVYVWLTARELRLHKTTRTDTNRPISETTFKWLQQFITLFSIFLVIWFVYLVPYVIPAYSNILLGLVGWYPVYIPLAVLIYWLGIKGYLISHTVALEEKRKTSSGMLPETVVSKTLSSLELAMTRDKYYLDAGLSLADLAAHIGVPSKVLSTVLNQRLQKSFTEYLNELRVDAFKKKIQEPGLEHLTIAGIAFECGFNSQPSFQRVFKQVTGMSPSEFRRQTLSPS
jgi:AraC-like DNA-binding protein